MVLNSNYGVKSIHNSDLQVAHSFEALLLDERFYTPI
jgi:hypothetical protein